MAELISAEQIEKLSHKIKDIRERALFNIISKLDNGILFDNDLARSKEILKKLFSWFLFEPCSCEDVVLALIKRIITTESGKVLIRHYGRSSLIEELQKIRSFIDPKYCCQVDEILELVKNVGILKVPPLENEIPLSSRSFGTVGTTATLTEGFIEKSATPQLMETNVGDSVKTFTVRTECNSDVMKEGFLSGSVLVWQPLIETDRHVLESVENSLLNPPQPSALLHSCQFFNNVLLHDFPAEIFIQRPSIIFEFFKLIKSTSSTRVANAVFDCLLNLTKALQLRINHFNDPSMCNLKFSINTSSNCSTPTTSDHFSDFDNLSLNERFENKEETEVLKTNQITIQKYCAKAFHSIFKYLCTKQEMFKENKCKINLVGINRALQLLHNLSILISQTVNKKIWDEKPTLQSREIIKDLNETFIEFGDVLEYFRLESTTSDNDLNYRIIYFHLLTNCNDLLRNLIPINRTRIILPKNLKNALSDSLLDVTMARMYSNLYDSVLKFVESFSVDGSIDLLQKYRNIKKVCTGMTATIKILNHFKEITKEEFLNTAKLALPSLEFHKNENFIKIFTEMCTKFQYNDLKYQKSLDDLVLRLLAYNTIEIKRKMYESCRKIVIDNIGTKYVSSGEAGGRISFLLDEKIFIELTAYGLTSEDLTIKNDAEDILIHLIKCKPLVSTRIWNRVVEVLISSFPLLICHCNNNKTLGRNVIGFLDPDVGKDFNLPQLTILKGNIQLMFSTDEGIRSEAYSRICWLLAMQLDARNYLPKMNEFYGKELQDLFLQDIVFDLNNCINGQQFYQPSSLGQVLDILRSDTGDVAIRRSALSQLAVMMEDPILHHLFLEAGGLDLILFIMQNTLQENNYPNSSNFIISIIAILKSLCLYNSYVREELSNKLLVFQLILRGVFLFFTEDRIKKDGATLLALLIFKDFILGNPSKGDFSIIFLAKDKMKLPFNCRTHLKSSLYTQESIKNQLITDKWCLSSLQIQWNCEVFGGFPTLLNFEENDYENNEISKSIPDILKLSPYDLKSLKSTSIDFSIKKYLKNIQNGTCHEDVTKNLQELSLYINFLRILKDDQESKNLFNHPWESSFNRFLKNLPSCEDDVKLLHVVIKFLMNLVPFYKYYDTQCWVLEFLQDPNQCILDLLEMANTADDDIKVLCQDLLSLIKICVCQEQHFLNFYCSNERRSSWRHVITLIANNLKFNEAQHFYNLAYLDSLLSCLVHLTATLNWSTCKANVQAKDPIPQLICGLCELITAFHCGKGNSAAISVMGLSITRHVLLILNHLVAELLNCKVKSWDLLFLDLERRNIFKSILALWASRDVVLRSAALQLMSSLTSSQRIANEIVNDNFFEKHGIYEAALKLFLDHNEASIVRESAANLLTNLLSHITNLQKNATSAQKNEAMFFLQLLNKYNFFNNLEIILNSLFILNLPIRNLSLLKGCNSVQNIRKRIQSASTEKSWSSSSSSTDYSSVNITTPGLITALCSLLFNILNLDEANIIARLQDSGLVKLIYRCLTNPSMSLDDTREMALYCDILEMNSSICSFLTKLATLNSTCLGTILHARDCLNVLISLLDPKLYASDLPQLLYQRNKSWTDIFHLLTQLLNGHNYQLKLLIEGNQIIVDVLYELGPHSMLDTVFLALNHPSLNDFAIAVLNFLAVFLKIETIRIWGDSSYYFERSVQDILESTVVKDHYCKIDLFENKENIKSSRYSVFEEIYFKSSETDRISSPNFSTNENEGSNKAGSELSKHLIYLLEICDLKVDNESHYWKNKSVVVAALSGLLAVSKEATSYAFRTNLMSSLLKQLKEVYLKLSLESEDCLRRVADKRRVLSVLKDLNELIGLITNFMIGDELVKEQAANLNIADILHKLWAWFLVHNTSLVEVLRLLNTFTTNCKVACQTLPLTSAVAGSGPRKSPSSISLVHAIISVIVKQMELINKMHDLTTISLCFNVLENCAHYLECRLIISKSNLLNSALKLHPAITKKQKPWDLVENIWLEFFQVYTIYPEGQMSLVKMSEVLELILILTTSSNNENKYAALVVLRNLAFYHSNRPKLLANGDFLNILNQKLKNGSINEKNIIVVIMWTLAANCQKAKLIFKSSQLDIRLQEAIKHIQLCDDRNDDESTKRMIYVMNLLKAMTIGNM